MDIISLNEFEYVFIERGYISLNELIRFLEMNIISCQNLYILRSRGGRGGGHVPPPNNFTIIKSLIVRKSVLCPPPPQYRVTNGAPNLKVAPRALTLVIWPLRVRILSFLTPNVRYEIFSDFRSKQEDGHEIWDGFAYPKVILVI